MDERHPVNVVVLLRSGGILVVHMWSSERSDDVFHLRYIYLASSTAVFAFLFLTICRAARIPFCGAGTAHCERCGAMLAGQRVCVETVVIRRGSSVADRCS